MSILSSYSTKCVGYLNLCNATDDLLLHSFFTKHFVSPVFNYCFQFQTCWRASSRASSSFRLSREHSLVFSSRWSWLLWMVLSRLAMTVSRSLFWLPASSSFLQDDTKKQTTNGYNNDYQHALIIMRYMECACFFQHWNLQLNMILRFLIIWTHQTKFKFSLQDEFMEVWQMYWIVWTRGFQTSCRGFTEAETRIKGREGKGKVDVGFQKNNSYGRVGTQQHS